MYIINPITKKSYSIFSKKGIQLLKKYIHLFRGGSRHLGYRGDGATGYDDATIEYPKSQFEWVHTQILPYQFLEFPLGSKNNIYGLLRLYYQNQHIIYMPNEEIGRYSPNQENIEQWIRKIYEHREHRKICDSPPLPGAPPPRCDLKDNTFSYLLFARIFQQYLRYIPFNEMMAKYRNIADEIKKLVDKEKYEHIFIFVENIWRIIRSRFFYRRNFI